MATGAIPDRWATARPADYFDNMLQNKTLKLFQKYAVHAADNPIGYTVATTEIRDGNLAGDFQSGSVPGDKLISWLHLEKSLRVANYVPGAADLKEGGDTIDCKASIAPRPGWVPSYFLPWKVQAVVWMTIPHKGVAAPGAAPAQPDPDIFFTSAINGCSVIFQGTAQSPTIYHCGGDPDYGPNPTMKKVGGIMKPVRNPNEAAAFWRALVLAHGDMTKGVVGGEVNKTQYIMDTPTADSSEKRTAQSDAYFKWLKKNNAENKNKFRIVEVRPWGCVFGIRTGNDWQFYLQESATIRYTTVRTTSKWGGLSKSRVDVDYYDVARPMCVRQVWPNAGGAVRMTHPVGLELL